MKPLHTHSCHLRINGFDAFTIETQYEGGGWLWDTFSPDLSEEERAGRGERRSLAIVRAGYESAHTGQPVHLRERFAGMLDG